MKPKKSTLIVFPILLLISLLTLYVLKAHENAMLSQETYCAEINCDEITRLPATIVTNNTKITVSTDSAQPTVTVYLFDTECTGPIQEVELKSGRSEAFTMLTGVQTYQIGIKSHTLGTTRVTLKIEYLP